MTTNTIKRILGYSSEQRDALLRILTIGKYDALVCVRIVLNIITSLTLCSAAISEWTNSPVVCTALLILAINATFGTVLTGLFTRIIACIRRRNDRFGMLKDLYTLSNM